MSALTRACERVRVRVRGVNIGVNRGGRTDRWLRGERAIMRAAPNTKARRSAS